MPIQYIEPLSTRQHNTAILRVNPTNLIIKQNKLEHLQNENKTFQKC